MTNKTQLWEKYIDFASKHWILYAILLGLCAGLCFGAGFLLVNLIIL